MDNYSIPLPNGAGSGEMISDPSVKVLDAPALGAMLSGRRVAFITTKGVDYIRNAQEISILEQYAGAYKVIASRCKGYPARLLGIYIQILLTPFREYDYVFVGFAPQLICPLWSWKFRGGLVIDFFISVYDTLVNDRQKLSPKGVLAGIVRHLDTATLRAADFAIADTKEHARYFASEFHAPLSKLGVLYLEANRAIYHPRCVPKRKELEDKYVVLYFGSILPLQGVDIVLECIQLLKAETSIFFQVIGPVKEKEKPSEGNVEFIPWLPEAELSQYIAASDLCLAGHFNGRIGKAKRTIAGKAYIYEAMGKPIILGDNPANRELFREDGTHFFVEMGSVKALAKVILEVWSSCKEGTGNQYNQRAEKQ